MCSIKSFLDSMCAFHISSLGIPKIYLKLKGSDRHEGKYLSNNFPKYLFVQNAE